MRKIIGYSLLLFVAFTQQPSHSSNKPQSHYLRKFSSFKTALENNNNIIAATSSVEVRQNENNSNLTQKQQGAVLLSQGQEPIQGASGSIQTSKNNQSLEKVMKTLNQVNSLRSEQEQKQEQSGEQDKQIILSQSGRDQQKILSKNSKQNKKNKHHNHKQQSQSTEQVQIFNQDFPSLSEFKSSHLQSSQKI